MRSFETSLAVRAQTPLLISLVSCSGAGKTYSALRLATGIQRVTGGDIYGIDSESRRMLHYASEFRFHHLPFAPPFGSLDYLEAIQHCVSKGAKTIIVDSMSLEHTGEGGMLEEHERITKELAARWGKTEEKVQLGAWAGPKANRTKLINGILQLPINLIACFRSKEKLRVVPGKPPVERGWQPIGGEELVYEMTVQFLLLPGANGVPTWQSEIPEEQASMKLPQQFRSLFARREQLCETHGEEMAKWAAGQQKPNGADEPDAASSLVAGYAAVTDTAGMEELKRVRGRLWKGLNKAQQEEVKTAAEAAQARITASPVEATP